MTGGEDKKMIDRRDKIPDRMELTTSSCIYRHAQTEGFYGKRMVEQRKVLMKTVNEEYVIRRG